MEEALVSVVMPTYNCAKYIGEAIESVVNQTYTNWELIIVDDCSTDETESVVAKYRENEGRVRYFKLLVNSGTAIARNTAIMNAKGKYIAFLDSDDLWLNYKLANQIKFMEEKGYDFTCTCRRKMNEDGKDIGKILKVKPKVDYKDVLYSNTIGNSTVIYDAERLGLFQIPDIRKRNDVALWLQILKRTKYAYGLDEVLSIYRARKGSISDERLDLIRYHWRLYREIAELSIPQSIWHIGYWMVDKSNVFKRKMN